MLSHQNLKDYAQDRQKIHYQPPIMEQPELDLYQNNQQQEEEEISDFQGKNIDDNQIQEDNMGNIDNQSESKHKIVEQSPYESRVVEQQSIPNVNNQTKSLAVHPIFQVPVNKSNYLSQSQLHSYSIHQFEQPSILHQSNITEVKNNIVNSKTSVFIPQDNWTHNNYTENAAKFHTIIQEYLIYLDDLQAHRQQLHISQQQSVQQIQSTHHIITTYQNTHSKEIYMKVIKQAIVQFSINQRNLDTIKQQAIDILSPLPHNSFDQPVETQPINGAFDDNYIVLVHKLKQYQINLQMSEDSVKLHLPNRKQSQSEYNNAFTKFLEVYSEFSEFLEQHLTSDVKYLVQQFQDEVEQIVINVRGLLDSEEGGYRQFYEQVSISSTLVEAYMQVRDESISHLKYELNHNEKDFTSIPLYLRHLYNIQQQVVLLKQQIKRINQEEEGQYFRGLQIKLKMVNLQILKAIEEDVNDRIQEGNQIQQYNFEDEEFNYQMNKSALEEMVRQFQILYQQHIVQYRNQGLPLLISECKTIKDLHYNIITQNQLLEAITIKVDSIKGSKYTIYNNYLNGLRPVFNWKLDIAHLSKQYTELISFLFTHNDVIIKIAQLREFKIPNFGWNNQLSLDEHYLLFTTNHVKDVDECFQQFTGIYNRETKCIDQLHKYHTQIHACLTALQQYIELRQLLRYDKITVVSYIQMMPLPQLNWPQNLNQLQQETQLNIETIQNIWELKIPNTLQQTLQIQNPSTFVELYALLTKMKQLKFNTIIQQQIDICQEFLVVALQFADIEDLDEKFCLSETYQELEELLGGTQMLLKLKQQDNNIELRNRLHSWFTDYFHIRLHNNFDDLFKLLYVQSQQGDCSLDPIKLSHRIDLLADIYRKDMNNQYVQNSIEIIKQIQDQQKLRKLFKSGQVLFKDITAILLKTKAKNLLPQQSKIISLINFFSESVEMQGSITDITNMLNFHQQLNEWQHQSIFINDPFDLAIILHREYRSYLSACRALVQTLSNSICMCINTLDIFILNQVKFQVIKNEHQCESTLIELPKLIKVFYTDMQSILLPDQKINLAIAGGQIVDQGVTITLNGQELKAPWIVL